MWTLTLYLVTDLFVGGIIDIVLLLLFITAVHPGNKVILYQLSPMTSPVTVAYTFCYVT